MDYNPSQCWACERKFKNSLACEAFPGGIPEAMTSQGGDHRLPLIGDSGKLFMIADAEDAEEQFGFWRQVYGS
jgi:hypothetical protein